MGIGGKAVEHKVKRTADKAMGDMGNVGKAIDRNTSTGPLDKADDAMRDTKDKVTGDKKRH